MSNLQTPLASDMERPGPLRAEDVPQLTLHTHMAQMLFHGRPAAPDKPEIIGLTRFASQTRYLWINAQEDDPYADWWMFQLDQALTVASGDCQGALEQLKSRYYASTSVSLPLLSVSIKPIQVPLQFTSPYAYRGAYLLVDLDMLTRTLLSTRHYALITSDELQRWSMGAMRSVKRAYLVAMRYKALGVTRADVNADNEKAQQARAILGALPADILDGRTRPRYAR